MNFEIRTAVIADTYLAEEISDLYKLSAKERGMGIAMRQPDYLRKKINSGNAIIAMHEDELAGFCYVETFSSEEYVSNSGLIVKSKFRGQGLARKIKKKAVALARNNYPKAKLFGITTSDIVMKINSELGYIPVAFKQLTKDEEFWNGCSSCNNYEILQKNKRAMCLCTAMLAPSKKEKKERKRKKKEEKKIIKQAVKEAKRKLKEKDEG